MKRISFLLFSIIIFISCKQQNQSQVMSNSSANEQLVQQYFEHFNNHDWTKMANMYSENPEFKDPALGSGIVKQSHQQIIDKYTQLQQMFPDVKDKVLQIYPSGDNHIIVEFLSSGTAPDSTKFELPICTIFTIENGLITKDFTYFDNFGEEGENK